MYIVDTLPSGLGTLTLQLYPRGSDTILNTGGDTADVNATKAGYYEWTVSETLTAGTVYDAIILTSGGVKVGGGEVKTATGDTRVAISSEAAAAADIWAYATRTLTQSAASVAAVMAGSDISVRRGDTTTITLTGIGNIAARTKLWFTAKRDQYDPDSAAMVLATESGGLVTINGRDDASGETCTITVSDATLGNLTIVLSAAATMALPEFTNGYYDIQMLTASGVTTMTAAEFAVTVDITQAIA